MKNKTYITTIIFVLSANIVFSKTIEKRVEKAVSSDVVVTNTNLEKVDKKGIKNPKDLSGDKVKSEIKSESTKAKDGEMCTLPKDDKELQSMLSPEQYRITKQNGTELPFQNKYWNNKHPGIYVDVISKEALFSSKTKFDSGSGWPSFTEPLVKERVVEKKDSSHGMDRVEVRSKKADSHLGHVFNDGPGKNGLRYCINSGSLKFIPLEKMEAEGYQKFLHLFDDSDWKIANNHPYKE